MYIKVLLSGFISAVLAASALAGEISLGLSAPLSGPAAALAQYTKGYEAFYQNLNEHGGINGNKVKLVVYDDEYSPPKALEVTRRLVERDEVVAIAGSVGTANAVATQRYLNEKKVPQLFVFGGAPQLNDPANYPWTSIALPTYDIEAEALVGDMLKTDPNGKIGLFYQDDEAGRAFRDAARKQLGGKIAREQSYTVTDVAVDSQIIVLKGAEVSTVFLITTPKHTALALRRIRALGWSPNIYITSGGSAVTGALTPAGLDNSIGVKAAFFRKTISDPAYADNPDVEEYISVLKKFSPGTDPNNDFAQIGYYAASLSAAALKTIPGEVTRESIRDAATKLSGVKLPLVLPGLTANTSATSVSPFTDMKVLRFNGSRYVAE